MRIMSWNILQGGGQRADAIAAAIVEHAPDVLTLQEFRAGKTAPTIIAALDQAGLNHRHIADTPAATNTVLIASRTPLAAAPWHPSLNANLAVRADIAPPNSATREKTGQGFTLLAAHFPHKRAQVAYFEYLLDSRALLDQPAMILGDLNCGIPYEDSETKSFANTHLFQSLSRSGWIDAWRSRNPSAREFTWVSARGNGYRYDHCFCTPTMDTLIQSIHYDPSVRENGLSDHSALIVELV
jgi:exonuclease III